MELHHQFTVPAPVDTAWETFMDLAGVAACFPGATVTSVEGDSFEGSVKVKLGPIALLYTGSGEFESRDDSAHRAVIQAKGKDKRGNGTAGATVTLACSEAGAGQTSVEVSTDLSVTGKPAQFGRGVMQDVSDKLLQQFVGCLEQRFTDEPSDGASATAEAAPPPATPAKKAAAKKAVPAKKAPAAKKSAPAAEATRAPDAAVGSEAAPPLEEAQPSPADAPAPGPTTSPVKAASPPPPARNVDRPAFVRADAGNGDDALDLGATVLPVLLRSYAPHLVAGVVGFVLGILIARSRRR